MIFYWPIKYHVDTKTAKKRTIAGLQALRGLIAGNMPDQTLRRTLVLGSWNIRNFDDNRFGDGPRLPESLFYIAEVISAFDVIAIQEICRDLTPLEKVKDYLGRDYEFIVTDVTEGPSGNRERLGFFYNTNKVWFRDVAGEIVLPFASQISDVTKKRQFARTPFSCAFQAGWFKFMFSTVHIYFGKPSKNSPEFKRRVKEIESVAGFLKTRAEKEADNYILVGDFNIVKPDDPTFNALEDQGFNIFQNKTGSNQDQTKYYDQISWLPRDSVLKQTDSELNQGVLNVFDAVFRDSHFSKYRSIIKKTLQSKLEAAKQDLAKANASGKQKSINSAKKAVADLKETLADADKMKEYYLRTWRTFQMSDHLPLWVELEIDFSAEYLDRMKEGLA